MKRTGRPIKTDWAQCLAPKCVQITKGGAKGFCPRHYQQLRKKLIDEHGVETGRRTRTHKKGEPCVAHRCTTPAVGRGLCGKHYQQRQRKQRKGAPVTGLNCRLCDRLHSARGFCRTHYAQWQRGIIDEEGQFLREMKRASNVDPEALCSQDSCGCKVRTRGWCNKHYMQFRAGLIDEEGKQLRKLKHGRKPKERVVRDGYIFLHRPEHPNAQSDGKIPEHRLVMSNQMGRPLKRHELVHHKDGVRANNTIENLQLLDGRSKKGEGHPPGSDMDYLAALQIVIQNDCTPTHMVRSLRKLQKQLAA